MKTNLTIIILLAMLIGQACTTEFGGCTNGNEAVETRMIDIESISKIELAIPCDLFIQEGTQFIEIEAPADIIDRILNESNVRNDKWVIELNGCYNGPTIEVRASLPQFTSLEISGAGNIETVDTLRNIEGLNLNIDGSGDMDIWARDAEIINLEINGSGDLDLQARDINTHTVAIQGSGDINSTYRNGQSCTVQIEGSGDIDLSATVDNLNIGIEGIGDVKAFGLCATNCDIIMQGSGDCEVKVTERLSVQIEGSGDVCYRGNPMLTLNIDGTGDVTNCN